MKIRGGVPYDPWCRYCEYGWVDRETPDGRAFTIRCPECEARAEARGATTRGGT